MTSIAARTDTAAARSAIHASLARRNRTVGILRIALPVLGAVLLAALLVPLYIGSLVPDFGFANVTIDRGNLIVETPAYSGIGADGSRYAMHAASARAALGNTDLIDLTGAGFELAQPTGRIFFADAARAQLQISTQIVIVDGTTTVTATDGLSGAVGNAVIDILGESLVAPGGADLSFGGGDTRLVADTMSYDGKARIWSFSNVTLELSSMPGEAGFVSRVPAAGADEAPAAASP